VYISLITHLCYTYLITFPTYQTQDNSENCLFLQCVLLLLLVVVVVVVVEVVVVVVVVVVSDGSRISSSIRNSFRCCYAAIKIPMCPCV